MLGGVCVCVENAVLLFLCGAACACRRSPASACLCLVPYVVCLFATYGTPEGRTTRPPAAG
jgi:hypothetical protein